MSYGGADSPGGGGGGGGGGAGGIGAGDDDAGAGRALSELLLQLEEYSPTVPDAVVAYYLGVAGFEAHDQRLLRLIAIAAQKFLADVANDALQHCKTRSSGHAASKGHKPAKEKRYTMTMEDLAPALHEYGITARKPHYFI